MRSGNIGRMALCFALVAGGCGDDDDPFSPTVENVAGSYTATTFNVENDVVGTVDLLANGATVTATLSEDGTTTGRLFVPDAGEDGGDVDEDLTGTWTLTGNTVTFDQSGDTFIRDVDFVATENRLTGEGTFQGTDILLVLTRDD